MTKKAVCKKILKLKDTPEIVKTSAVNVYSIVGERVPDCNRVFVKHGGVVLLWGDMGKDFVSIRFPSDYKGNVLLTRRFKGETYRGFADIGGVILDIKKILNTEDTEKGKYYDTAQQE